MWNRAELKRRGKTAFKSNYGRSVLAAIILSIAAQGIAFNSVNLSDDQLMVLIESFSMPAVTRVLQAAAAGLLLTLIISIFLLAPVNVGCRLFFIRNSSRPEKVGTCFSVFKNNYWNVVMVMFIEQIYLFLWGLLFIIPGMVKAYSYRMVPYILAEHPDMSAGEAITRSREMMNGHKWKTFVLDLSFLGWTILSLFTLGILTYLYVMPYMYSTDAELYRVLSGQSDPVRSHDGGFQTGPGGSGYGGGTGSYGGYGSGSGGYGSGYGQEGTGAYGRGYDDDGPYDEPDPHDDLYNMSGTAKPSCAL